jgi:hypothetical protein
MTRNLSLAVIVWLLGLSSCSSLIPSLGPGLHDNALAYDAAISDINDRVLLANIVRARDFVPLNITELSTVTGTLSAQASIGLSVPFGGNYSATPRGTLAPSVQLGAEPTFSMAALNTRGFTLNIIQPISPVYVASKWNTGISHELLLLLFVKDIQFADSFAPSLAHCTSQSGAPPPTDGKKLVACHHKFINNPDSIGEEKAFRAVIESMLPSVGLKVMTILEPVGPSFPFLSPVTTEELLNDRPVKGNGVNSNGKDVRRMIQTSQAQNPLDAYTLATKLGDGQYHLGNDDKIPGHARLYHVFTNQVAVCADDPVKTPDGAFYIYPIGADVATAKHAESIPESPTVPFAQEWQDRLDEFKIQCASGAHSGDRACSAAAALTGTPRRPSGASAFASYSVVTSAVNSGAIGPAAEAASPGGRAGANAGGGGAAMPGVSSSLSENRTAAFLRADDCYTDQAVREPTTESDFRKYTETIGHIEWRSVAEVFQYLGGVLRQEKGITWNELRQRDVGGSQDAAIPDAMFILRKNSSDEGRHARLTIDYAGEPMAIGSGTVNSAGALVNDESLLVLSLLSELVNSAKISSDIPVTQQLQVLP